MRFVKSSFEKEFKEKRDSIIKKEALKRDSFEEFFSYERLSRLTQTSAHYIPQIRDVTTQSI